jgi:hypothetical protein
MAVSRHCWQLPPSCHHVLLAGCLHGGGSSAAQQCMSNPAGYSVCVCGGGGGVEGIHPSLLGLQSTAGLITCID